MSQRWAWLLTALLWLLAATIWLRHWHARRTAMSAYPLPHYRGVSAMPVPQQPTHSALQAY
ncbi:hypothetical protein HRbin17_00285 [bacterium HR17]|uniref:Uncharacterized protein n=1 Tax=Candidatus Fervidibacter japonicus TaxID=2035412 RepID=A0A2H5X9F4_9BACT|nr:hypothetical protein HRbin17_00285 [bacterium HR17]